MSVWTIEGTTANGTFAALDLSRLRRTLQSQAVDKVFLEAPGASIDGTALFSYGESVTIKKDNVTWFVGRCVSIPRQGTASEERISYEFDGPWWYLEHIVYQQRWNMWDPDLEGGAGLNLLYKSRVILCQNEAGAHITTGAQITAALTYAIAKGAPIAIGTIDADVNIPWDEQIDITCAEVINRLLRYSPDIVCWFDYSAATPTLHARKRANLTALNIDLTGGASVNQIAITPRYDLQVPGVVVRFEQTHEDGDATYETMTVQTAGDADSLETLVSTIELGGSKTSWLTQDIVTEDVPAALDDVDWWEEHVPYLADVFIDKTIVSASRAGTLPRFLVEGQIQDWMNVSSEDDVMTAKMTISVRDAITFEVLGTLKNKIETVKLIATNATTRTYKKLAGYSAGETIPTGMAQAIYDAWSQLQYDGSIGLEELECSGTAHPGLSLNITNGLAAWATMKALVQRVEESVDDGKTTITFGPAKRIQQDDLVSLLRGLRNRKTSYSYISKTTGLSDDAGKGKVALSGPKEKHDAGGGAGNIDKLVARQVGETYTQKIIIDPTEISKTDANVDIKPREMTVCVDGVAKKVQFMCSAPYD